MRGQGLGKKSVCPSHLPVSPEGCMGFLPPQCVMSYDGNEDGKGTLKQVVSRVSHPRRSGIESHL